MKLTVKPNAITEETREMFTRVNDGMEATRDVITITEDDGTETTYTVFKGKFTPYDHIRDCGDHYIFARHDHYDRIDKATLEVVEDVRDA